MLAHEEAEQLRWFVSRHPGARFREGEDLINTPPRVTSPEHRSLLAGINTIRSEQEALEISLREEQLSVQRYSLFSQCFRERTMHDIFQQAITETTRHHEILRTVIKRTAEMSKRSGGGSSLQ